MRAALLPVVFVEVASATFVPPAGADEAMARRLGALKALVEPAAAREARVEPPPASRSSATTSGLMLPSRAKGQRAWISLNRQPNSRPELTRWAERAPMARSPPRRATTWAQASSCLPTTASSSSRVLA